MKNLKFAIAYNGAAYNGYQSQPGGNTVQDNVEKALSKLLNQSVKINGCSRTDAGVHAREFVFSVKYDEALSGIDENVFMEGFALHYPYKMDIEKMLTAAKEMIGTHDFAAFCKAEAKGHLKSTIRTVHDIKITGNGQLVEFYVSGAGFLHNMVRIIVGTLIYVNEDKRSIDDVRDAVKSGDREKAGKTLPPCGLYLNRVFY